MRIWSGIRTNSRASFKKLKVRFLEDASSAKLITSFSLSLYSVMTFIIATDGGTEQKLGVQKKTLLDF